MEEANPICLSQTVVEEVLVVWEVLGEEGWLQVLDRIEAAGTGWDEARETPLGLDAVSLEREARSVAMGGEETA